MCEIVHIHYATVMTGNAIFSFDPVAICLSHVHTTRVVTTVRYMVKTELVFVRYGECGSHLCLCHVESELTVCVHGSTNLDGSRGLWVSICDP